MRAAKLVEKKKIVVSEEEFCGVTGDDEVVIQVKAVGICGTDLHIFQGERDDVVLPRVMGHELSGIVTEAGSSVTHLEVGDRVILDPVMACGVCPTCQKGHENVCDSVKCFGVQMDGGFQDYIRVPARQVYRFPDHISFEEAALAEPFSVAANILSRAGACREDKIAVIGAGTIGLSIVQAAKGMGACVLAMDISDTKLDKAKEFGADAVVNTKDTSFKDAVGRFAPGGVDVVIDAVGISPFLEQCIDLAAPYGRIMVISFDGRPAKILPVSVTKKELSLLGSRMNCRKMPMVVEWLEKGMIQPQKMISRTYELQDIQQAFNDTMEHSDDNIKTIIKF